MKTQILCFLLLASTHIPMFAEFVPLQQPTATFSQHYNPNDLYEIGSTVDGVVDAIHGWAVSPDGGTPSPSQSAVFETTIDVGFTNGTLLTFTLIQSHIVSVTDPGPNDAHNLGRFRLSVTTDARDTFADGLANGGDVEANWTVVDPISFISASGTTLTELQDHSILASGPNPSTDSYTVTAITTDRSITGVRLEALQDPSLPHNGPGRRGENGNFVLSEFQLSATPVSQPGQVSVRCAAEICWLSSPAKRYRVQFASAVDSKEWFDLGEVVQGTGNEMCVYDSTQSKQKRFYRYVEVQ